MPLRQLKQKFDAEHQALLRAPFKMLERSHEDFPRILDHFRKRLRKLQHSSSGWLRGDLAAVQTMLRFMDTRLIPHMKAEEMIVFPHLLRHLPELKSKLASLVREHAQCRRLLKNLKLHQSEILPYGGPSTSHRVICQDGLALLDLLDQHIQKETQLLETL